MVPRVILMIAISFLVTLVYFTVTSRQTNVAVTDMQNVHPSSDRASIAKTRIDYSLNPRNIFQRTTVPVKRDKPVKSIFQSEMKHVRFINSSIKDYVPSSSSIPPRIPHIIHQIWNDEHVPKVFSSYIRSWVDNHPHWEYWFWTTSTVRVLIQQYYPDFLTIYDTNTLAINKADLMRYFIMHRFGGVYADLDLESLRPMDNWTLDNDCVMSEDNYVHGYSGHATESVRSPIMICLIASRPGHPYFRKAMDMIKHSYAKSGDVQATFCDEVYVEYLRSEESKKAGNIVTVTHPNFFLPAYDVPLWKDIVQNKCLRGKPVELSPNIKLACGGITDGTSGVTPKSYSYTNHYWVHTYWSSWQVKPENRVKVYIKDIVPEMKNVTDILYN